MSEINRDKLNAIEDVVLIYKTARATADGITYKQIDNLMDIIEKITGV